MPAKNGRKSQSLITNESIRDSFNSTKLNNDSAKDISSGIVGDLSAFLAQNASVSRRKRTSGGAKSVGGLPGRPISKSEKKGNVRRGRRTSAQASGSNLRPAKPASVPIFVIDSLEAEMEEASDIDSENEGESNDIGMIVEDHLDNDKNISRDRNMENAIQLHMSRTDNLLFSVFPRHIAEDLRAGRKVEPQNHEIVTIFFSDIVGFTDISSKMDALKISDMLDRLYHSFDALSHYHDVFKVETIGDAYMAVTNLAEQQPDHCKRIAEFSIDAIRVAKQTLVDKDDSSKGFVNIRVGFHSGPVVSSVVGSRNPRYCLFGDTVNTASRMESNSAPNSIHCSDISAKLLQEQSPQMRLFPRGVINVKGKGNMKTFWVNEEREKEDEHSMKSGNGGHRSFFKSFKVK
jgi:class 3 adenylate cyclase